MFRSLKGELPDSSFLLRAAAQHGVDARELLAAVGAGIAAAKKRRTGAVYTALLSAAVLVTALLTVGFLIAGEKLDPSAVLSLVSFSFAGCLFGAVVLCHPAKKHRKSYPKR